MYSRWRFCSKQGAAAAHIAGDVQFPWELEGVGGERNEPGETALLPPTPLAAVSGEAVLPLLEEPVALDYLIKLADSRENPPKRPCWMNKASFKQLCWFRNAGSQLELVGYGMEQHHVWVKQVYLFCPGKVRWALLLWKLLVLSYSLTATRLETPDVGTVSVPIGGWSLLE